MNTELTVEQFEPLDGQIFRLSSAEPVQDLRLIEVLRKGQGERKGGAFSLLWQSDTQAMLPQGSYVMTSAVLGDLEIFIVPVGQSSQGIRYEAVFT